MGVFLLVLPDIILVPLVDIAFSPIIRRVKEDLIRDIGILILIQDSSFRLMDLIPHLYSLGFLDLLRLSILVIPLHSKFLANCVINLVTLLRFVIQSRWNDRVVKSVSNIQALHTVSSQSSSATTPHHQPQIWLTDSGATNHMTTDFRNLSLASPYPSHETVQTANGEGQSHREDIIQRTM
ncbi:uncharacterized protein LOC126588579 [Malus sylvestris]|uniref:uncharacterized protein LOC126588579 n=1 Tax=Malus sylvestris TaxID=3752 RepID=UPI0021ACDA4A|nr:uncharacterized protein LOC126588579 [Malus sylvestris]